MPSRSVGRNAPKSYRSLFISDLHLGARACRVGPVQEFLRGVEAETIYLVGDIFDIWHGGRVHWSDAHDAVLTDLHARARDGTRIVYLPGNHDAAMRAPDANMDGWELREAVADMMNRTHRKGMRSQYSAENVAIQGGGRVAIMRACAAVAFRAGECSRSSD